MKHFFVVIFTICVMGAAAIDIVCEYEDIKHSGYSCRVKEAKIADSNDNDISSVSGNHWDGKSNADVLAFHSHSHPFKTFPKNLKQFFPKVGRIHINKAQLKSIEKSDLAPYGDCLRAVSFSFNSIPVIKSDVFSVTPNLDEIGLDDCKIQTVEKGAFKGLSKLEELQFVANTCYSGHGTGKNRVAELIGEIENNCNKQFSFAPEEIF